MLGKGSNFIIRLPLTLAIIQSLMVTISDEKFPCLLVIQTVENIDSSSIKKVNGKEVLNLRGM